MLYGPGKPTFIGRCVSYGVGSNVWKIADEFSFISSEGYVLTVPRGFLTDFASVPRALWWAVPVSDGVYDPAAVVHDYAVRNRKLLALELNDCHRMFYEAMRARGVAHWKAYTMYRAVWIFNRFVAGPGDGTTPPDLLKRVRFDEVPP